MPNSNQALQEQIEAELTEILSAEDSTAALEAACRANPQIADRLRRAVTALRDTDVLDEPERRARHRDSIDGYTLGETLGRGGMGIVFRAHDPTLDREVALKVLRPELLHFEDSRQRFRREIDSAARLRHPGIVSVLSAGEDDGVPYFTMELVDGTPLSESIAALRGQPIGLRRGSDLIRDGAARRARRGSTSTAPALADGWINACLQVTRMIAEALEHAHERGVFHRDVKPSNVLIAFDGRPQLLDFGLARLESAQDLTKSDALLGSTPYMPPEHVRGSRIRHGPAQDVYSLGVTLIELLTLQQPFLAATAAETRQRIVAADHQPLRRLEPTIGRELETVCLKATDLDPTRRYQSARAFANDLDCLLERRPIQARRAGLGLRALRFAQRHPTASVAAVLGILLLGASGYAAVHATRNQRIERQARLELIDTNLRFLADFIAGLERIPGNTEVRVELTGRAIEQLTRLETDEAVDSGRLFLIALAHLELAKALGNFYYDNTGEYDLARARYRHVCGLAERIVDESPLAAGFIEAKALTGLSGIARFEGDMESANALAEIARDRLAALVPDEPAGPVELQAERLLVTLEAKLASFAGSRGDHATALAGFEAVRDFNARQLARDPANPQLQLELARARRSIALALHQLGEHSRCIEEYTPLIVMLDRRLEATPDDARVLHERLHSGMHFSEMLIGARQLDRAIEFADRDLERCEAAMKLDSANVRLQDVRLQNLYNSGWARQERAGSSAVDAATKLDDLRSARERFLAARELAGRMTATGKLGAGIYTARIDARLGDVLEQLGER